MTDTTKEPAHVSMESIKDHTYDGIARPVGTVYDVDPQYVDSVTHLGFAVRVDRVEQATQAKQARETAAKAKKSGTAVGPMTTHDTPNSSTS